MPIAVPVRETRWRIPVVLAVTVFVNYLDRSNLALALPRIAEDFGWTDREIGSNGELLLAVFFLSYGLSNMLLSPFAERFGPKRSVIAAIVAFSLFTILSAPLGQWLTALIVLRLLLGLGEGVHIPMLSAITSHWFPVGERSRANAIWSAGILLTTATAPLIIIPLINLMGWRLAFAVLGVVGMLLSIALVWFLVEDRPRVGYSLSSRIDGIHASGCWSWVVRSMPSVPSAPSTGCRPTSTEPRARLRAFGLATSVSVCGGHCRHYLNGLLGR